MFAATDDSKECQPSTSSSMEHSHPSLQFELSQIILATNNFDDSLVIGHGGFGKVYRGNIINGSDTVVAAIKRLDSKSSQGAAEFWAEVEMLSKLRHCHLVSLLGYCNFEKEMILVYEYMPNGTLADHLHKLGTPLSWIQRLKICIGAARGLHYLHTGMGVDVGVIHRDVKTSNILLDESWAAKISDFGLSKIGPTNQPSTYVNTLVKGTFGYLDPEYFFSGKLTRKSDVYAFGVVLLEVLCRKPALDMSRDSGQENLAKWAQESIKEGNIKHIVDSGISGEISPKCLKEFVRIAKRCLLNDGKRRPTMVEVVFSLESIVASQEKMNNSLQPTSRTIFGWMFPYPSNGDNSVETGPYSTKEKCTSPIKTRPMESPHVKSIRSAMVMMKDVEDLRQNPGYGNLDVFTYEEMRIATKVFRSDQVLGEGGFGIVYKGVIEENVRPFNSEIEVAIKKYNPQGCQGQKEWLAEVNYLGQLQHPNLVKLIGYCCEEDHRLLVYEFMPAGSLENHLFRRVSATLTWSKRMKIVLDAAKGLAFLHDAERPVIYRGFVTSNILLDVEFNAKLSDFGLAKDGPMGDQTHVSTQVMGTYGYAAPEYIMTGRLTAKSDIYGFGVVLLEMLIGKKAMDNSRPSHQQNLVDWAGPLLSHKKKLFKILDPRMDGQYSSKAAIKVANLARQCINQNPKDRPAMVLVVEILESLQTNEVGLEET